MTKTQWWPRPALASPRPTPAVPQTSPPSPSSTSSVAIQSSTSTTTSQGSLPHAQRFPLERIKRLVSTGTAIVLFGIAVPGVAVIVWTKQSLDISNKSLSLAQWTAKKDFFEFCQTQQAVSPECNSILGTPLERPPLLKRLLSLDLGTAQGEIEGLRQQPFVPSFTCYVLFAVAACIVLLALSEFCKIVYRFRVATHIIPVTEQNQFLESRVERLHTNLSQPSTGVRPREIQTLKYRPSGNSWSLRSVHLQVGPASLGANGRMLTARIVAAAPRSFICETAARKLEHPIYPTKSYFARAQHRLGTYRLVPACFQPIRILKLPIVALDGTKSYKQVEFEVVEAVLNGADCVLNFNAAHLLRLGMKYPEPCYIYACLSTTRPIE